MVKIEAEIRTKNAFFVFLHTYLKIPHLLHNDYLFLDFLCYFQGIMQQMGYFWIGLYESYLLV
jgi:hypothetical protein